MIPPEAETQFKRRSNEKSWVRKALVAAVIAGIILTAVGLVIYFHGTKHPQ